MVSRVVMVIIYGRASIGRFGQAVAQSFEIRSPEAVEHEYEPRVIADFWKTVKSIPGRDSVRVRIARMRPRRPTGASVVSPKRRFGVERLLTTIIGRNWRRTLHSDGGARG